MPIRKDQLKAVCHDCGLGIEGPITINVWQWYRSIPIGVAEGHLVQACYEHRNENRQQGEGDSLQHIKFSMSEDKTIIGEMTVSSTEENNTFVIEDGKTKRRFIEEIRAIQRERGY